MKTRIVRLRDISKDDEDAWRRLAERALEPNPFAEPDFLLLSSRHFESYADARLVIAQDGTEFKGAFPIARTARSRMPPRTVANSRGYPRAVACLDTPLVDRSSPDEASEALVDALCRAANSDGFPGIVSFDWIGADGPVLGSLHRACEERRCPTFIKDSWERATVSRVGQWANPVDGKRRREIARRTRLLAEESGAEVVLVDRTSDPAAGEDFLEMESSGWKGRKGGGALVHSPDTAAWFREWHPLWVAADRLRILSLNVGSISVAMQCYVRGGEGLFCFRIAFDEEYAKYKPGAMLLSLAMSYLRDNTDAAWIDSTTDKGNPFFLGMLPERRTLARLLIGTGGTLDRALVSALPTMTKLVAAQKQIRKRLGSAHSG